MATNMYANHKQDPEADVVPPVLTRLVPNNGKPAHRKAASLTIFRIAVAAVAALGLIFLTAACFRRTRERPLTSADMRKLAENADDEGPPGRDCGDDNEPCQGEGAETNAEEGTRVPQEARETQEREGSSAEQPAGPADASTAPRKRKAKTKHNEQPTSPTDASGGEPPAKRRADTTSVERAPERSVEPASGRDKTMQAIEELGALCGAFSGALARAEQAFDGGTADDTGVSWLLNFLEGEARRSLAICRAFVQDAASQLTEEEIAVSLQQIDAGDALVHRARELIYIHGIPSTSSASDGSIPLSVYPVFPALITTAGHTRHLRSALERYEKDMTPQNMALLVQRYFKAQEAAMRGQTVLLMPRGPMHQASHDLLQEQVAELSKLLVSVSQILTTGPPGAAAASYASGAPGEGQPASSAALEETKKKAEGLVQRLLDKLRRLREAIVALSNAFAGSSSAAAKLALTSLNRQTRKHISRVKHLVNTGLLSESAVAMLEAEIKELEHIMTVAEAVLL